MYIPAIFASVGIVSFLPGLTSGDSLLRGAVIPWIHGDLAQMTYEGYLSCDQTRTRGNCDIELNRKKSSIKDTCYGVWTGNWPERATLDPATIRLYINWCKKASEDIDFAEREFAPLVKYVSRYRRFSPSSENSSQTVDAALNTQYFLNKCASGSAERAARAMELWGTKEHGAWVIRKLEVHIPSRYKEVLSACERKSWARQLKDKAFPLLSESWSKQFSALNTVSCAPPSGGKVWTQSLVDEKTGLIDSLKSFRLQTIVLKDVTPSPLSISASEVDSTLLDLQRKESQCSEVVAVGRAEIERQLAEQARQEQLKAAREAEERRAAAARKAAAERRAAAERAAARQREAAAKAAAEAQRRREAERQRAIESVELN